MNLQRHIIKNIASTEVFLNNGFGFCIEQDGIIVAECVSIFNGNGFAEIDIVTHEAYHGKGLAKLLQRGLLNIACKMILHRAGIVM